MGGGSAKNELIIQIPGSVGKQPLEFILLVSPLCHPQVGDVLMDQNQMADMPRPAHPQAKAARLQQFKPKDIGRFLRHSANLKKSQQSRWGNVVSRFMNPHHTSPSPIILVRVFQTHWCCAHCLCGVTKGANT